MEGLHKSENLAHTAVSDSFDFNVGIIKGSASYYFMLTNTGETPIVDISIISTDSTIELSPSSISRIEPAGTNSVLPILKVTILHGVRLENGIGYVPLQIRGPSSKFISVKGTSDSLLTLDLRLDANFQVFDYNIFQNDSLLSTIPVDQVITAGSFSPAYNVYDSTSVIRIVNIGNVPLNISGYDRPSTPAIGDPLRIEIDSVYIISRASKYYDYYKVDGGGVVADSKRFNLTPDGSVFFVIVWR